ncbi:hypothetical protein PSECIP111951_01214 [Pseudoalteromonas holothuriae]|uniref:DUF3083 family protein n=1 Tax=Pseudoalteromonas holothuriae TaxID=2963714 RepID=A0A9W4QY09_9GAMM|nr:MULTISPECIES: DUF3083 family protein [unclassified Pseudoalteromonas]CAH9055303.1 hypothetical protein PSECIP111951_01214 [Pseudoalteromonas sp. CIP111951]CAH9058002.1 hypothetical protein PSECIP111854_02111 [Pseudoalteromonas sp. CIP111854]
MASMTLNRVYIPTNARNNQYILAEFKPTEQFYNCFDDLQSCYERLARQLFAQCDEYELHNVHLIANDKLPIVRFHEESYCLQTQKQMLFFYNPKYHEAHKSYWDENVKARKISLLFLATGSDIRANAANFHIKVKRTLEALLETNQSIGANALRVRDHQHLTYDIFAKSKGNKESYGYKLRSLYPRYQARNCTLPDTHSEMTYATFSLPVTRALKTEYQHLLKHDDYSQFYKTIEDAFLSSCAEKQLSLCAFVADGRLPLVRNSKIDKNAANIELQKLSFDIESDQVQNASIWESDKLVDTMNFVIVAHTSHKKDMGYGRFMSNVESVIRAFADRLHINPNKQDVNIRFFQHISYQY